MQLGTHTSPAPRQPGLGAHDALARAPPSGCGSAMAAVDGPLPNVVVWRRRFSGNAPPVGPAIPCPPAWRPVSRPVSRRAWRPRPPRRQALECRRQAPPLPLPSPLPWLSSFSSSPPLRPEFWGGPAGCARQSRSLPASSDRCALRASVHCATGPVVLVVVNSCRSARRNLLLISDLRSVVEVQL